MLQTALFVLDLQHDGFRSVKNLERYLEKAIKATHWATLLAGKNSNFFVCLLLKGGFTQKDPFEFRQSFEMKQDGFKKHRQPYKGAVWIWTIGRDLQHFIARR